MAKASVAGMSVLMVLLVAVTSRAAAQEPPKSPEEVEEAQDEQAAKDDEAGEAEAPAAPPAAAKKPVTTHPDAGFGANELAVSERFPDPRQFAARVDRRGSLDAMADRNILWPSAHTPEQYSFVVSNYFFYGNQLSFSPTDDLQLSTTLVIPAERVDFSFQLSGKQTLYESFQGAVSIQPFLSYRAGNDQLDTQDFGGGAGLVADLYVTDNFLFGLFVYGYGTMWYAYDEFDYGTCRSRRDYIEGFCTDTVSQGEAFPAGGHGVAGGLTMTYYFLDQLSFRFETFSGAVSGSFLGMEYIYGRQTLAENRARFETGEVAAGVPYDSNLTAGLGLSWSNGMLAVQASTYAYNGVNRLFDERQILLTPMFAASAKF